MSENDPHAVLAALQANARKALAALDAFDMIVEDYYAATPETVAKIGLDAAGQPEFLYRLRRKADFRRSTMRKVLAHIAAPISP
jgi:hypothetical protein